MIQRIQSLYLLLAFLIGAIALVLPWVTYLSQDQLYPFLCLPGKMVMGSSWTTFIMISLFLLLDLVSISLYKKRSQQIMLIRLSMVLSLLMFVGFGFDHYSNIEHFQSMGELKMTYGLPVAFPLVNLILLWLAMKGVQKDEALIKSVDRLR